MIHVSEDEIRQGLREVLEEMGIEEAKLDLQILVKPLVSLVNRMNIRVGFNANATVFAGDLKTSNMFGEVIAKTIEKWFPDCCAVTGERSIYNRKNWSEKEKAFKLLLVKGYEALSLDKLHDTLSEFEKNGWNPTVILCTTEKVFEKMRRYENGEYRLFYSLCGYKVMIPEMG